MHSVQELHSCLFLPSSAKVILASYTSSTFSVYSSINLWTNFLLHLQFSLSEYSPTSHDLLYLHSQLLGFHINPLSHTPLSINYLHSHLHLSLFQRCLLLQTLPSSLHLHLHVSCHSICLVLLVLDITLNTLSLCLLAVLPIIVYWGGGGPADPKLILWYIGNHWRLTIDILYDVYVLIVSLMKL